MRSVLQKCAVACFPIMLCTAIVSVNTVLAKTCPPPVTSTIPSYSNTYYPGQQVTGIAGSTSVTIGTATYGTTPISDGILNPASSATGGAAGTTNSALGPYQLWCTARQWRYIRYRPGYGIPARLHDVTLKVPVHEGKQGSILFRQA